MQIAAATADPTHALAIDLAGYIEQRDRDQAHHLIDGIPDYSFSLDRKLRRQLSSIAPLRWAARSLVRSLEPLYQQIYTMDGIAVGPDQYPEIHALSEACSRRLGIGMPRIFIVRDETPNAMTLACDDLRPSVILTTRLVGSVSEKELLAIIGHECGHIHNLHGAYNTLVQMLINPLAKGLLRGSRTVAGASAGLLWILATFVGTSIGLFLARWSRCAEVTCDRAGVICAGDPMAMARALAKLQTGGETILDDINIDAYVRQMATVKSTPVRLLELGRTHPLTHKRIEAIRLFATSNILRSWRLDLAFEGSPRPITEVDAACEPLIRVWDARSSEQVTGRNERRH